MANPAKQVLRLQLKEIIKGMTPENRKNQSTNIKNKILQSTIFHNSKRVSVYLSTELEVDTIELLQEMFHVYKEVFVPIYNRNEMEMVKLNDFEDYQNLPLTKWNIKQPSLKEEREKAIETGGLDLILVPGVGFTKSGGRLGHGKGYYDKYLTKLRKVSEKSVTLIGLAFQEQILKDEELPLSIHDVILDCVITS